MLVKSWTFFLVHEKNVSGWDDLINFNFEAGEQMFLMNYYVCTFHTNTCGFMFDSRVFQFWSSDFKPSLSDLKRMYRDRTIWSDLKAAPMLFLYKDLIQFVLEKKIFFYHDVHNKFATTDSIGFKRCFVGSSGRRARRRWGGQAYFVWFISQWRLFECLSLMVFEWWAKRFIFVSRTFVLKNVIKVFIARIGQIGANPEK